MFLKIFPSHIFLYTYLIGSFTNRDHVGIMWEPQYNLEEKVNPASFTEKRWNKAKHLNWNSIRFEFVKKTSIPNSVKSLGYIKGYSSGSLRSIKSPSNPIRYNYQKICSRWRSPKTILEIKTMATFLSMWSTSLSFSSFSDFTKHRKKTNKAVVFSTRSCPKILENTGTTNETFRKSGKQHPSRQMSKGLLVCPKVSSAFHPFMANQMSTRNSWWLSDKKKTVSKFWLCVLRQLNTFCKKRP